VTGSAGAVSGQAAIPPAACRPEPDSGAGIAFQDWPHVSFLELGALPSAVPCGRAHTRLVLGEWRLGQLADDAEMLVSELLTNALRASWTLAYPGAVALRLLADPRCLLIEVWDQAPGDPQPGPAEDDAESGRGFTVIEALSARWGTRRVSRTLKVIWCELLTGA
jgi:anti-sigma regulatory factor (Ser/Thr protein kinase)